ncbi:protease s28 pro-x carboxypeptidase-related [Holotrichia oblita]|uniref:Protease s28 pro-x carboxypeptidase-related n=1 Tax=Holotrichia oblita TaxID=644536 RepID=A0ACB9TS48_HOLOL|nr:protease s28 pro-x carboxypeptidase-related [Holotrichia oblita]
MRLILFYVCIFLFICENINAWRIFHHGRMVGGNLGKPFPDKPQQLKKVSEQWFMQNLDHFNPGSDQKWKQRYFVNGEFYMGSPTGPIFLMIGGEGEASDKWMTQGTWIDYAKTFKALCFQLEHRYYGESHPTPDLSTKNLQYLTSQQALADLAFFIESMNEQYKFDNSVKWIVFGGSYPGSLAAWLRMKYPHLVQGAMSASGPLLAEVDFKDYYRVVDDALTTSSDTCATAVKQGTEQIVTLLRHMIGQRNINELFKLCDPIDQSIKNSNDVSNFFETLAGNFAGVVQYNKDNRIGKGKSNITIDTLCDIMDNDKLGPPIDRLAAVNTLILDAYNQTCLDYKYDKMIGQYRNISWDSETSEGGRQWTYQTCTEFGFFQSSNYTPQNFGDKFPVDFFIQQCVDIFGPKYNKAFLDASIRRTNTLYGALNIDVTNVVFVHGSIDPWHALGITQTQRQAAPAIYIEGTAHCANMYPKAVDDPPQLNAARVEVLELIDSWIRL